MTSSRTLPVVLLALQAATARADQPKGKEPWYERPAEVDVASWTKEHGVRSFREKECFESPVGVAPKEGLICRHRTRKRGSGWNSPHVTSALVYQLRDHRLRLVWRGPVATWENWVDLTPRVSDDGTTLVLSERSPGDCQRAYCQALEKRDADIHDQGFIERLVRACSSRGRWVWKNGAYRRDASDQPPRLDLGGC